MYYDYFKALGTGLTVGELKAMYRTEHDDFDTNMMFDGMDDNDAAIVAFKGWVEERGGYTIILAEEA